MFPYKTTFTVEQIPDMTGRVVIVTGAYQSYCHDYTKKLTFGLCHIQVVTLVLAKKLSKYCRSPTSLAIWYDRRSTLDIQALLNRNAKVYMASRSKTKADEAIQELKEITGKEAIFLELDLASLASVRLAAKQFLR